MSDAVATMLDLLELRARNSQRCGYTFCFDDRESITLPVEALARRAHAIAASLQQTCRRGDRALLVFPPGLEFISAFFGCVAAGVLPVPATYPKPRRPMPRLSAIHADCDATFALTTAQAMETLDLSRTAPDLIPLRWVATDTIDDSEASSWKRPDVGADDAAFLQYTSGSTSQPKGVAVSHRNLLHNLEMIRQGFNIPGIHAEGVDPVGVSWLPAYHDMGLIGGVFNTLYSDFHTYLLSPASFLHRPLVWLETITAKRGTITGAPNFAYDLCVSKTTAEDRAKLDLSSLRLSLCAAEPIRPQTLARFTEAFKVSGFPEDAFYPCYGLAEATLLAAGRKGPARPKVKRVCRSALGQHDIVSANGDESTAQELVACGAGLCGQEVVIVDPQTCRRLENDQVGEIWITGPSVARGYWNRPEDTARMFGAKLADDDGCEYLRSGDLGFISEGELYITGRLKEVIIIRGRNHYPQDIERSTSSAHEALPANSGAAFAIEDAEQERLVVVHEIERSQRHENFRDVLRAIRAAIVRDHEVDVQSIVLIRPASLPRTTSGKIQRALCRTKYLEGDLKVVAEWSPAIAQQQKAASTASRNGVNGHSHNGNGHHDASHTTNGHATNGSSTSHDASPLNGKTPGETQRLSAVEVDRLAERIETRMLQWLVDQTGVAEDEVDRHRPLAEYGLDSLAAVELSHELENWLHVRIPAIAAWNYPTPQLFARWLAEQSAGGDESAQTPPNAETAQEVTDFERLLEEIENLDEQDVQAALEKRGGKI